MLDMTFFRAEMIFIYFDLTEILFKLFFAEKTLYKSWFWSEFRVTFSRAEMEFSPFQSIWKNIKFFRAEITFDFHTIDLLS